MGNTKRFVPITRKVGTIIVAALVIGIGAITFFFARSLTATIDSSTTDNMAAQSDILFQTIETLMLDGEADLAVAFFNGIGDAVPNYTIRVYRTDGVRAFADNITLQDVNNRLGGTVFAPKPNPDPNPPRQESLERFRQVATPPTMEVFFNETDMAAGTTTLRAFKPLLNLPKCTGCHGSDHTVRGVLDIRNDITASVVAQRNSLVISSALFLGMVGFLAVLLTSFLRRTVISPVKEIGLVCSRVTEGDFDAHVQYAANDEIGRLGSTVNSMVTGLHERFELSKFVSSSTIESLTKDRQARDANITLFFSDIRGFTSYSERNTPETVVSNLNELMVFQTQVIQEHGGDIDKYVGDEIFAIFTGDRQEERAVRASLEIVRRLTTDKDERFADLEVGIGLNRGAVIVGMVGSEKRADFTVIGDNVNLAARLCSAAAAGEVLATETLVAAVVDIATVEGPYSLRVKGKRDAQRVYKIKAIAKESSDERPPSTT